MKGKKGGSSHSPIHQFPPSDQDPATLQATATSERLINLLPKMMLHGMEYPSGHFGAALLVVPLPSLLLTPSLLTGVME